MKLIAIAQALFETRWKSQTDKREWDDLVDSEKQHKWIPKANHWVRALNQLKGGK